ncbi:hypothetical protein BU16DRAFT_554230 [Lophium mytilinum]|uniref:BTB domain-containing protein n=1 Tax=Lophium mytilinum TaxID=390894 RepID=A0A6A6RCQ1_9PEZI|nr:hypothetical protein BU16DRAFT_554230 [Lophium mytilinum]
MGELHAQFSPDAEFSDVVIRVHHPPITLPEGTLFTDYRLHCVILSRHSRFFQRILTGPCRTAFQGCCGRGPRPAHDLKDATTPTNVIEIHEEKPVYFDAMIQHMYEGSYKLCEAQSGAEEIQTVVTHVGIYKTAQKYDNIGLQSFSVQAVTELLAELASSSKANPYASDCVYEMVAIKAACEKFYNMATKTKSAMGRVIASPCCACDDLVGALEFEEMLKEKPTLAVDILLHINTTKPSCQEIQRRFKAVTVREVLKEPLSRKI